MYPRIVNVYQKPKQANPVFKRYLAYGYKHSYAAVGGCDTAAFSLALTHKEAELWLEQHLGNRVAVYVDNPVTPIWEGFVNRMKWQVGGLTFTVSLDQLMNRVTVSHSPAATPATSAAVNNTTSQAIAR